MTNSSLRTSVDLEQLVEAIGDAIVVSDASGTINLWNPAAERLFGFTQAEALGNSLDLTFTVGLLHGPQREATGIVAVIRDETRSFIEKRNLLKRLGECEGDMAR